MAQIGDRDAEPDLGLKEGSHTGSCFEEKQKTALSQDEYILHILHIDVNSDIPLKAK